MAPCVVQKWKAPGPPWGDGDVGRRRIGYLKALISVLLSRHCKRIKQSVCFCSLPPGPKKLPRLRDVVLLCGAQGDYMAMEAWGNLIPSLFCTSPIPPLRGSFVVRICCSNYWYEIMNRSSRTFCFLPIAAKHGLLALFVIMLTMLADSVVAANGIVTTPIGSGSSFARSVALQADGKILVAGSSSNLNITNFSLVRYNADGSLDTSFGTGGKVTTSLGSHSATGNSVALQVDGKILVAGGANYSGAGNYDFGLVRYNSNGSLDTSFGTGGIVITASANGNGARGITVMSNGMILLSGSENFSFAIKRYNPDGTLDTSFSTPGVPVTLGYIEDGYQATVLSDGKIVMVGNLTRSSFSGGYYDFALFRYNSDGTLDASFNTSGKVTTDLGADDRAFSLALQPDGKILAAGSSWGSKPFFALARYNVNGSLDTTFNASGKVITDYGTGRSVAIQSDGKILVAGYSYPWGQFSLVRYNSNGSLDTSFGTGGETTTEVGTSSENLPSIAIRSDGIILVAGTSYNAGTSNNDFTLLRYNSDGSLDTSFNSSITTTSTTTTSTTTTTTQAGTSIIFATGWNLVGNSMNTPLTVATEFSDTTKVSTVWKWISNTAKWAFFSPSLVGQALADYSASSGYDVLSTISGGEGFWVNAKAAFTLQLPASTPVASSSFQGMASGWNLISIGSTRTPSGFNTDMSVSPPTAGVVPQNITTLWAWDNSQSKWYFYSPSLEAQGGTVLSDYITSKGYLNFTNANKTLGQGVGFWANKP